MGLDHTVVNNFEPMQMPILDRAGAGRVAPCKLGIFRF
jgi:hypothetical protein